MKQITAFSQVVLLVFITSIGLAQPANDDCLGSFNVIDDGSCISGTTALADDSWTDLIGCQGGPGGNGGNHPDVWYSFTATNSSFSTTVSEGPGWAGTIEVTLLEPDAVGCGGVFTELASGCGNTSVTVTTTGLVPGNTYYIIVSNPQNGTPGAFDICTETTAPPVGCTDNENCNSAEIINLNASDGGVLCINDCNTGAAPGLDFVGNNCYDQLGPTVWYQFTTDAVHSLIDISLTSSDFSTPEFTIFENTCSPWTIITGSCTEGTGGSATLTGFQGLLENTTYLIAISDVNGGSGSFELCIEQFADNSPCNTNSEIVETGSSDPSTPIGGPYSPGEVVSFCYNLNEWQTGASCNYLQGIVPTFGPGWDPASFDADGMPVSITSPLVTAGSIEDPGPGPPAWWDPCIGETAGWWEWFPAGTVDYNDVLTEFGINGALPDGTLLDAGWFFYTNYDHLSQNCNDILDPNQSYGDNSFPFCNNTLSWQVCFDLTVGPIPNCTSGNTNLDITFQTYADGEIGAWTSLGCVGNTPQIQYSEMQCCPIFDNPGNQEICDSYTLPAITGSLLTGNEAYYTGSLGTGTQYSASDVINFADFPSYPITLYIYDATSCGIETSFTLTIGQTPVVSLAAYTPLCIDAGLQVLGGGSPAGGVYSGIGVTDNGNGVDFTFDPLTAGANTHTITYTVTTLPNPPACSAFATNTIQVFALPVLTFTAPNDLCINAGVQSGLGGATPAGGVYSGPGVSDDGNGSTYSFDPLVAGAGVQTITYTYADGNSCTNIITDNVEVFALPILTFTAINDLCINGGVQSGSGATPIGGVYSGPGVTDNGNGSTYSFDPLTAGAGVHSITYTYTDGNSCTNTITDDVEVFPTPVLNFPALTDVCLNAGIQAGIGAATVSGGVYSGTGVTDDGNGSTFSFDPIAAGVGVHVITYTVTDANSCTASITQNIEVFPTPVLNFPALADVCLNAGVQVGIGAGTVSGGVYSGTGVTDDGNGSTFSFDPIAAGVGIHVITYTVTDANSCTDNITQTIEVVDTPIITGTFDVCVGLTTALTGSGAPNAIAPWTSSNTAVATVDVNGVVSGVSGGTVTITYTDDNGCTAQQIVTVNALPVITLTPDDPDVCDALDGFITVNGAGTGTVTWSGGAAGSDSPVALPYDITGLGAGGYSVTFTDGTTGCISTSVNTNLNNPGAPIINPIANYTACEVDYVVPDPLDPTNGITGTNLTGGQAYYSAPGGNAADLLPQGTVITSAMSPMTVYAYDNNGTCDSEVSFVVNVNTNPTVLISPDPASACEGTAIPLNGNPAGGSGVYSTNTWTGDIAILNASNVVNPTVLAATSFGVYNLTYTVTDNNGCVGTDDIIITINEVPNLSGTQTVCVGLTTTINSTGTPDATTPWSSSDITIATVDDFGVVTGVAAGTVTITFLDANGCSNTISITVNANPSISLTPDDPNTCNASDGFITVSGTGTGIVDWAGDANGTFGPTALPYNITGLPAGNYNVTFTDANGCISNNPATTLNNPNAPVIDPIADTISCAINFVVPDAATYVTGSFLTGNQEFYDQPGGNIADLVAAGTVITAAMSPMTLYAYDINGACDAEVSFVVTINQNPTTVISPVPAELCAGLTLQLNGNPVGGSGVYATHEWTNTGATSLDFDNIVDPTFTNGVAGNYDLTYTVTDDNGCIGTSNIQVTVNPNPTATISPVPAEVCAGVDLQLNGNPSGGSNVYTTHDWTNTGSTSLDFTNIENPLFNNAIAGNYDLTYTVTDDNGCIGTDAITVLVNENPVSTITPDPAATCAGIDLQMDGGPTGGSNVFTTHLWSGTGSTSLNDAAVQNPLFNNVTPGNYELTYTVTDDNGCVGTNNIVVTVTGNPSSLISPDPATVCSSQNLQLNGNPFAGTAPYATHAWTNAGAASLNVTNVPNPIFNTTTAGTYELTYTVTDANGCFGSDNITVTVVATPTIDPLGPIVACDSYNLPTITGIDLTGNQGYFSDIQANAGTSVTGPITSSTTIYMFDGTFGCSDEVAVNITINPLPSVGTITGDGSYCQNEVPIDVLVETVGSPDWTVYYTVDGVSQTASGSVSPINLGNLEGTYVLDSISDLNCSNTATGSVVIDIKPTPATPLAGTDAEYCSTIEFDNMTASGTGGSLTWYTDNSLTQEFGVGDSILPTNTLGTTSYFVTETIDGCEGPASEVIITVNQCDITLPTAFTPNNDGNNDNWEILSLDEAYPNNIVYIYNRWGNLIFEHNSQTQGKYNDNKWDGRYNGEPLPVGSYFFVIDFNNEAQESVTGAVSIILD